MVTRTNTRLEASEQCSKRRKVAIPSVHLRQRNEDAPKPPETEFREEGGTEGIPRSVLKISFSFVKTGFLRRKTVVSPHEGVPKNGYPPAEKGRSAGLVIIRL